MLKTSQSFLQTCNTNYQFCLPQGKLQQLRKCKRQVRSEYERAIQSYSEEDIQMKKVNAGLEEVIDKLKIEKASLQQSLQVASAQYEQVVWDRISLENALKHQQQQITIYQHQKEEREEAQNLFRRQNLLQLKEKDSDFQKKSNAESAQTAINQQSRTLESQILKAMKTIQAKTQANRQKSERLQQIENASIKVIQQINTLEDEIQRNTITIERKLAQQSSLANRYGELKRSKKQLLSSISQVKEQIGQEQLANAQLSQVERSLNKALAQIQKEIQTQNSQISKVKSQNLSQKIEIAANKECLIKLRIYLENLKNENEKIELYMEHVIQEDQRIKAAIDRKHKRASQGKKTTIDKSMSSTFAE